MDSFALWYDIDTDNSVIPEDENSLKTTCTVKPYSVIKCDDKQSNIAKTTMSTELSTEKTVLNLPFNEDIDNTVTAKANFNLWHECGWNTTYLDIGFMFQNLEQAKAIYFYIPFKVEIGNIKDLGCQLNSSIMVNAVFNESFTLNDIPGEKRFEVKKNDELQFGIYCLDIANDINITQEFGGTILKIDTGNMLTKAPKIYIRFRIVMIDPSILIQRYRPKNAFLESTLQTTYIIDFRFNYQRSLDPSLRERMHNKKNKTSPVGITSLHFLLMTQTHVEVSIGLQNSVRKLENNIWDEYVFSNKTDDIAAYHCKEKGENRQCIDSWEFFAKMKVNKSTSSVLGTYLFVLGLISVIFNLVSNVLWSCIETKKYTICLICVGVAIFCSLLICKDKGDTVRLKLWNNLKRTKKH